MPKSIKKVKNSDGYWERIKTGTKHRIGTRRSGKSANLMSSEALEKVTGKDRAKAKAVLATRGIYLLPENL